MLGQGPVSLLAEPNDVFIGWQTRALVSAEEDQRKVVRCQVGFGDPLQILAGYLGESFKVLLFILGVVKQG